MTEPPCGRSVGRWSRRGLVLYVGGLMLDTIWPGTILPFYGAMFVVAAVLFTLRSAWVLAVGLAAALAAAGLHWWQVQSSLDGDDTSWFFAPSSSVLDRLTDVAVNGTHPLLPWLAFLCTGIVLGRQLRTDWWRPAALGVGFTLFGGCLAHLVVDHARTAGLAAVQHRPVRPGPALHGQRARHRPDRLRRDLVARRALRHARRRSSCCAMPVR